MKNPKMRSIMPTWSAKKMWEIRHAKNRHTLRTPTNKITVARSDGTVIEWMRPVASKKSPVANCAIAQATAARTTRRKPRPAPRRAERKITAMTNKSRRVLCMQSPIYAVECRRRIKEQVLVFLPGVQRGFGKIGAASAQARRGRSLAALLLSAVPVPSGSCRSPKAQPASILRNCRKSRKSRFCRLSLSCVQIILQARISLRTRGRLGRRLKA
jgi:hypothetical protein